MDECWKCGERVSESEMDDGYCLDCYEEVHESFECSGCHDELPLESHAGDDLCQDCHDEQFGEEVA